MKCCQWQDITQDISQNVLRIDDFPQMISVLRCFLRNMPRYFIVMEKVDYGVVFTNSVCF